MNCAKRSKCESSHGSRSNRAVSIAARASTSSGEWPLPLHRRISRRALLHGGRLRRRDVRGQRLDRHRLERALVRGAENDGGRDSRAVGVEPPRGAHAPAVARLQAREAPFRAWCREVVSRPAAELEKLLGHHGTHRVTAEILRARSSSSRHGRTRSRVGRARQELAADDVAVGIANARPHSARRARIVPQQRRGLGCPRGSGRRRDPGARLPDREAADDARHLSR